MAAWNVTVDSPRWPTPDGFRGELYPYQQAVLHEMIGREQKPAKADLAPSGERRTTSQYACILAAPFGSGKTPTLLALILAAPEPPQRKFDMPIYGGQIKNPATRRRQRTVWKVEPRPAVAWLPSKKIHATLVVAASAVIAQWEASLKKFTPALNFFTVTNANQVKKFKQILISGELRAYQVVLLRVGKTGGSTPLVNAMTGVTDSIVWARVIVDDFDTVPLERKAEFPPAFFTWLVSATARNMVTFKPKPPHGMVVNIRAPPTELDILDSFKSMRSWHRRIPEAARSAAPHLGDSSIGAARQFIQQTLDLPVPENFRYFVKRPAALARLNGFQLPGPVAEALQGDAVGEAAHMLGFNCDSAEELFRLLLQKDHNRLRVVTGIIAFLEEIEPAFQGRRLPPDTINLSAELTVALRSVPDAEIEAAYMAECRPWRQPEALAARITDRIAGEQRKRATAELALQRLRDNASEDQCQICLFPWEDIEDDKAYLLNCCQITVCFECVTYEHRFLDDCPSCAKQTAGNIIATKTDVMAQAAAASGRELAGLLSAPGGEPDDTATLIARIRTAFPSQPKLATLAEILLAAQARTPAPACRPGQPIAGLLGAQAPAGRAPGPLKALVFAYSPSTAARAVEALDVIGLEARRLIGQASQKRRLIEWFKTGTGDRVLIAVAAQDCAGIDLPECTDIIMCQVTLSPEVTRQAVGRGQRPGRRGSLQVHVIEYEN